MSDKANIITQAQRVASIPGGTYGDLDYHGAPPWDVAVAAGWRRLDPRADFAPADGYHVAGYTYQQDPARDDYALETAVVEAIPDAYPTPDSVVPVLDADGNQTGTARLLVDSSGALVVVTDSASPQRPVADIGGLEHWAGKIDEVRIYNRALSADEIKQLYRMGALPRGIK